MPKLGHLKARFNGLFAVFSGIKKSVHEFFEKLKFQHVPIFYRLKNLLRRSCIKSTYRLFNII